MKPAFILFAFTVPLPGACTVTPVSGLTAEQLQQQADKGNGAAPDRLTQQLIAGGNYPQAMRRLQQAATGNGSRTERASAARLAGDGYQRGLGAPHNQSLALHWWQKAAAPGDAPASEWSGEHCRKQHQDKRMAECMDNFRQAAKQGQLQAQKTLAHWYGEQGENKIRHCASSILTTFHATAISLQQQTTHLFMITRQIRRMLNQYITGTHHERHR